MTASLNPWSPIMKRKPIRTFDVFGRTVINSNGNLAISRVPLPTPGVNGDYGWDPIGDGTVRMVPSGDVLTIEEASKRLSRKRLA